MRYKNLFILFCFIFFGFKAFPAVFVVTSNADSGPGTLREALTLAAANGSTVKDYINFNLPDTSRTGRTIVLTTKLPDVSSNLVIDGSTQIGSAFGVSNAKILLLFNAPAQDDFAGLSIINKSKIEIYGLYLKSLTDFTSHNLYPAKGFKITNSNYIQIGDVNKGNVVSGFTFPLAENLRLTNDSASHSNYGLTLKSNFFGIESDGKTASLFKDNTVNITNVFEAINMGGTTQEGNLFATGVTIDFDGTDTARNVIIKNNKVGVDYEGTSPTKACWGISIESSDPMPFNIYIEDNVISRQNGFADIYCIGQKGTITILRNYIEVNKINKSRLNVGEMMGSGITVYGLDTAKIGSNNVNDANYIAYCKPITSINCVKTSVNKNSIFCASRANTIYDDSYMQVRTQCTILGITSSSINGKSAPKANIELFYSDKCKTCSPQTYFASTIADSSGYWVYNGPVNGTVIASSTYDHETSNFTKPGINIDNIKVIYACTNDLGSIIGAIPFSATNIKWLDSSGAVVGTNPDLLNVKIGKYKLLVQNGDCADSTSYFEIKNKFQLDTTNLKRTHLSCGNKTGSISGINLINNDFGALVTKWRDINGKVLTTSLDLNNAPAGSYYLLVKSADSTCSQTFGPFLLKNVSGPNIDQSNISIQSTNCGQSTGSIRNLNVTGTGTLKYTWWNSQQQTVGTTKDLVNQPAGTYKLQVTDDTQCGPIYSANIEIPETNGIVLDESAVQAKVASCSNNNGSITGLKITGATQYQWADAGNKIVGTTADLQNMKAGDYVLTVSNAFGCSKTSKTYHIGLQPLTQYPAYTATVFPTCFGQNNGSVSVTIDALVSTMRWVNSQGLTIGITPAINSAAEGTYQLYLTDQYGCENLYKSFTIPTIPQLQIVPGSEQIINDQCALKTGSITNIQVTGGMPPYTYSWLGSGNTVIASTLNLSRAAEGNYTLQVSDASKCNVVSAIYVVQNQDNVISSPTVNNVQLCSPGDALLQVSDPSPLYSYRLYDSETNPVPLDEQTKGIFKVDVKANKDYYISRVSGVCESVRTLVHANVGLTALDIANTFTPNGDGINDYWKIKGIDSYPNALIQVFTRYGGKLFESKGYEKPFDGTSNGTPVPIGVYYYIINMGTNCNLITGSLTIIR